MDIYSNISLYTTFSVSGPSPAANKCWQQHTEERAIYENQPFIFIMGVHVTKVVFTCDPSESHELTVCEKARMVPFMLSEQQSSFADLKPTLSNPFDPCKFAAKLLF